MERIRVWVQVMTLLLSCSLLHAKLISMNESNYRQIIGSNDLVLVLFHNNWSEASARLEQGFDDASKNVDKELERANFEAKFVFAYANCAENPTFLERFALNNFPTFKLIVEGSDREFTGPKTVEALTSFVLKEMEAFVTARELRRVHQEAELEGSGIEGSGEQPQTSVFPLTDANFDKTLGNNEVLVVLYYVDWCGYSRRFKPYFAHASKKFSKSRKSYDSGVKVVFGSINCDENKIVCKRYWIQNFPTVDVFRNGEFKGGFKANHNGLRDVIDLIAYVQNHADLAIQSYKSETELRKQLDPTKHHVISKFSSKKSEEFLQFLKVAKGLSGKCVFHDSPASQPKEEMSIKFLRQHSKKPESLSEQVVGNSEQLKAWLTSLCNLELVYDSFLVASDEDNEEDVGKEKEENDTGRRE